MERVGLVPDPLPAFRQLTYWVTLFAAIRTTRDRTACPVFALMMTTFVRCGCCGFAAYIPDILAGLVVYSLWVISLPASD